MEKILVFDMDGTIADFYGVEGWLNDLKAQSVRPYATAKCIYNEAELVDLINTLKEIGWYIVITSWLAKNSTKSYDDDVRQAKKDWLEKIGFPYDEIHLVKYGTTKANCTRKHGGYQILVDDNEQVRKGWSLGDTINANEDILKELKKLINRG